VKLLIFLAALAGAVVLWEYRRRPGRGARLPRNRVRAMRIRLHLRRRPFRGHATGLELWLRFGRVAAFRRSGRIRPSLTAWARLRRPREHSVYLGRAHGFRRLNLPLEEHVVVTAPPRVGKTALVAHIVARYPGPVLSTTTKADVFELTSGIRAEGGPVHVFNPQAIGGVPSTFRWNPVAGCADQAVAIRRADAFAKAVSMRGVEDQSFWTDKASDYLRAYFHAAALARADMRLVARWVAGAEPDEPEGILAANGARQWALTLAELRGEAQKTASTVRMTMSRSISFMTDPALAACVLPAITPGGGFDINGFLASRGTLYMIAESQQDDAPVAPLFACLAAEIHYQAAVLGSRMPAGRLDPPLLMALDEIVQVCPVPLPAWLADSGGKGIQVISVAHGEAQLASRWADHGRQVILDTSGTKVLLPGITDVKTLEAASKLCGQAAYREHGHDYLSRHDAVTPDMIRQLPAGFALVLRGSCAPVMAKLPVAWKTRTYRRARRRGEAVAVLRAAPAAEVIETVPAQAGPAQESEQPAPLTAGSAGDWPWSAR
jgi:type IV secretory pathway TraG/TraD family ATPase VirD4